MLRSILRDLAVIDSLIPAEVSRLPFAVIDDDKVRDRIGNAAHVIVARKDDLLSYI